MAEADQLTTSQVGYTETLRAVLRAAATEDKAHDQLREVWRGISVVALDHRLSERAGELAASSGLRSLDAIHLASAESLSPRDALVLATFDRRLWDVARDRGHALLPEKRP